MTLIPVTTYDEESEELNLLALAEDNSYGGVDLIFSPYTMDAKTYTLTVEETWRLIRQLAETATAAASSRIEAP